MFSVETGLRKYHVPFTEPIRKLVDKIKNRRFIGWRGQQQKELLNMVGEITG